MSRYIDADAYLHELEELIRARLDWTSIGKIEIQGLTVAICELENQPTADVVDRNECLKCVLYPFKQLREQLETNMVEVIPCKDCVSWQKDQSVDLYGSHYCPRMDTRTMGDDYCSFAERREDDGL